MMTVAITLLFAFTGLFAFASIAGSLLRYGPSALRLREALRACSGEQELRFSVSEHQAVLARGARILRPDFGAKVRSHPAPKQLRAAA